uniref:Uncharacterized protein n=1 Tax=Echinococcus canadensis TaxID=519352 RepID=A0A915F0S5_9CEST
MQLEFLATWQTCCYAALGEESLGVAAASILWMTLPYAFATACSNGFMALTPHEEFINIFRGAMGCKQMRLLMHSLSHLDPCTPYLTAQPLMAVVKALFGRSGLPVLLAMYAFINANITVFQLFLISSILTFDIYAIHMWLRTRFYRGSDAEHAKYMNYQKRLVNVRCTSVLVTFSVVLPIGLLFNFPNVKAVTLNDGVSIMVSATVGSLLYSFFWEQITSAGVVVGTALSSSMAGVCIDADILNITFFSIAIVGKFIFPPLVVHIERLRKESHNKHNTNLGRQSWHRIYEMDNPLAPWTFDYAESLSLSNYSMESYNRPDSEEVRRVHQRSWCFALGGPILFFVLYALIIPGLFYTVNFLDIVSFKIWFGLSGPMWFLVGTATPLCLIGVLITQFRTRAPGAETFPQLMLARFGKRVHLLFCFITILNNLSILTSVVNTGSGFYSVISERVTFELAWIITVIVGEICASVGSMSDILPFSATIFVYLLTMALVITIKVFFYDETGLLGKKTYNDCSRSIEKVHNATHAVDLSHEKDGDDHLTMRSYFSLEMGLCKFLARPTVEIAKRLLGPNGLFALFSLYAFIVTTATIMQIFSVTKILTIDIYAVHLRPFRVCYEVNCCIFCGKSKDEKTRPKDKCLCCDPADCQQCQEDLKSEKNGNHNYAHACNVHSGYLKYLKGLKNVRISSILIVLCVIVPMGLILNHFPIIETILSELPTFFIVGGIGSFVLALFWGKLTESAVFIGTLTSSTLTFIIWVVLFQLRNHAGLNLSKDEICLAVNGTGIMCSFILPVIVVLASKVSKKEKSDRERAELTWQRTLDLGNPVNPWAHTYSQIFDLPLSPAGMLTVEQITKAMRPARIIAYAALALYVVLVSLFLGIGCIPKTFTLLDFKAWIVCLLSWLVCSLMAAILLPILGELPLVKCFSKILTRRLLSHRRQSQSPSDNS